MRIVAAEPGPWFSVQDVHNGWVEALKELGNQVAEFNLSDRLTMYGNFLVCPDAEDGQWSPGKKLYKAFSPEQAQQLAVNGLYSTLFKVRPDVLFVTYPYFYDPELFVITRHYGIKVVMNHTESPYDDDEQLKMASCADLNLVNDPTNIDKFREIGPTHYMPHSYRPGFHCPGPSNPDLECDVSFVGTGYPSRIKFFEDMDWNGIDLFLAGNWGLIEAESKLSKHVATESPKQCVDNDQTVEIYRSSKVGINLYRKETGLDAYEDEAWACGPREIEMAATGLFFIREPRGEGDELFPMLPRFTSPNEAEELIRWHLDHESRRQDLANQARSAVQDRTFKNRAAELMRLLET